VISAPPEAGGGSARDPDDEGRFAPDFVHRDINHVLGTGQSLSVGAVGYPPLSRTQPYKNLMFTTGVIAGATNLVAFTPLIEGALPGGGTHPDDETLSSGFANLASLLATTLAGGGGHRHDILVSAHGVGGTAYIGLKKGTPPFAAGMAQVKAGRDVARGLGKSYVVRAVTLVHGESDHQDDNKRYADDLAQWQADYEEGVKEITQQSELVPMLHTQISNWTRYGQATSHIPGAQLAATLRSHGKLVLVGPKYHLPYVNDGIHLTNEGYRQMGEDYAKVYRRVVLEGRRWEPLRPSVVTRDGAIIKVRFEVPSPPIVLDTRLVSNPGHFGFEFTEDVPPPLRGAPVTPTPAIVAVATTAPDEVTITLSSAPAGTNKRLRYAFTGASLAAAGPRSGPRGNLRDSDRTASRHGYPLHNWCVHFDESVP
jgi:hypothetical protein